MEFNINPIKGIVHCDRSKKISVLSAPGITYTGYFSKVTKVDGEENIQLNSALGKHEVSVPVDDAAGWFYTDEYKMLPPKGE